MTPTWSSSETASASSAFHQTASSSHTATPVPASTGETAAGSVRGRAPAIHWAGVAMAGIVSGLDVAGVSSLRPVSGSAEEILGLLREWDAAPSPEPLVIATSGSTGEPKRVVLSRDAMRASALATQERLGGPGQWVLNLPPSYVAGVQVLYRSVRGRAPSRCHDDSRA